MEENNKQKHPSSIVVSSPKSLWLSFFLNFFTLGFYSSFWFVGQIKEFNQLLNQKFTPWLWFFVPFFGIAQLFALPRFINSLNTLAINNKIPVWGAWWRAWVLACFSISFAVGISEKIEFPGWFLFLALFVWATLMTILQSQVNRIKQGIDGVTFKGSKNKLSILEWVFTVPLSLFTVAISYPLVIVPLLTVHLKDLPKDTSYIDEQQRFDFPIKGDGWSVVEAGTHSDGNSEVELQGPLENMHFIVFNHGVEATISSISEWRIEQAIKELPSIECKEKRSFAVSKLSVISRTECWGNSLGDPVIVTISIIETEKETIELYGYLSTVKNSFNKHMPIMRKMAKGFEPL